MIPSRRQAFNREFQPAKYRRFLDLLEQRFGEAAPFRHSETPCFFPAPLIGDHGALWAGDGRRTARRSRNTERDSRARDSRPRTGRRTRRRCRCSCRPTSGSTPNLQPKLVEIQGFPSLYAYQPVLAEAYREAYGLDPVSRCFPAAWTHERYRALACARRSSAGTIRRTSCCSRSIPASQKTRHDFVMTEQHVRRPRRSISGRFAKQGSRLYYERGGTPGPDPPHLQPRHRGRTRAPRQSRCPSISATTSTSNGPAIPTGSSA